MKGLHMVAFILLVVGGLNWGLSALGWNVVNMLLGSWPMVEKVVLKHRLIRQPNMDDILNADEWARDEARMMI